MSKIKAIGPILEKRVDDIYRHDKRNGRTYRQQIKQFTDWLNNNGYKRITVEHSKELAKEYIKLKSSQVSTNSLNATVSALVKVYKNTTGIKADREYFEYKKQTTAPVRGRNTNIDKAGNEYKGTRPDSEEAKKVIEFAKVVGIREKEYAHLKGNDYKYINNRLYVLVRHGKGNKYQWQLIQKEKESFVKSYFDGTEKSIFSKEEAKAVEHSNLHAYRREHAQEMYKQYENLSQAKREELKALIQEQFRRGSERDIQIYGYNKHHIYEKYLKIAPYFDVPYKTRKKDGQIYDRVGLLAVSCLHLSHWRLDVTVANYMR